MFESSFRPQEVEAEDARAQLEIGMAGVSFCGTFPEWALNVP
jgi:hypothetical protein